MSARADAASASSSFRGAASLVVALAAPVLATAGFVLAVEAAEWSGRDWWADTRPRNAAEAAASGRAADLVRHLRRGDHPEQVFAVRGERLQGAPAWISAVEGAMWLDDPALVRLLEREGAVLSDDRRRQLACLARDLGNHATADYLADPKDPACAAGAALDRIRARTGP